MAILANGKLSDEQMPLENIAPHGFAYKFSGNYPLSLARCNKIAERLRQSIKTLGTDPRADDYKADLAKLEAHMEQVKTRDKMRRRQKANRQSHSAQCPTCGAEYDFDSAKEMNETAREWKRKV